MTRGNNRNEPTGSPASAPPNAAPIVPSAEYGQWARNQRALGTVYGGPGQWGPPASEGAHAAGLESSGSLTGHILAQGDTDAIESRSHTKVILIMTAIAAALIVVGVVLSGLLGWPVPDLF
jgi:hypothetical protein